MVNGVSADLVEQVLDEYGDPAEDEPPLDQELTKDSQEPAAEVRSETDDVSDAPEDDAADPAESDSQESQSIGEQDQPAQQNQPEDEQEESAAADEEQSHIKTEVDPDQLSEKQRETFQAILEDPEATQKELATRLGVSSATICTRVNKVEGFEWTHRKAFVADLFDTTPENTQMTQDQLPADYSDQLADLQHRIETIEQSLESDTPPLIDDPELVHKILHACLESEQISDEEELRILQELLGKSPE